MKNHLYFNRAQRAQALFILEGHFQADLIGEQLFLSVWDAHLKDALDVLVHDDMVTAWADQFTAQFGKECHAGNFLTVVELFYKREAPHKCIVEEVGHLYRAGFIESLTRFYSTQL